MSFDLKQFKELVTETLKEMDMYSESAVNLVLGTVAQESEFGTYLKQLEGGPAMGICQIEPDTFYCTIDNYLIYRPYLVEKIGLKSLCSEYPDMNKLVFDLMFSIKFCRLKYRRVRERLPFKDDIYALAVYWKKYYNTYKGKGVVSDFIGNYHKYILEKDSDIIDKFRS